MRGAGAGAGASANASNAYDAGYNQTLMLIEAGDADAAIRVAEGMLAQSGQGVQGLQASKAAELHSLVSRAYVKAGRIKEAYDALRQASRLEPAAAEYYIDLAMLCLEHENYDLGLEIVDVGLKHRPDSVDVVSAARRRAGDDGRNRTGGEGVRSREPRVAGRSRAIRRAGDDVDAEERDTEGRRDAARTHAHGLAARGAFYALGMALLRSGAAPDDEAERKRWKRSARPRACRLDFSQAQAELGKLLLKRNDVPGAIEHLEKALALEPDESAPAYALAQAYRRSGRMDRAQELLTRVSRLNAQNAATIRMVTGSEAHGRQDRARELDRSSRGPARAAPPANGPGPCERTCPCERRRTSRVAAAAADGVSSGAMAIEARYDRANGCASAGDVDGAIAELRRIVDAARSFAAARYQLGVNLWTRFKRPIGGRQKQDLDDGIAQLTRGRDRAVTTAVPSGIGQLLRGTTAPRSGARTSAARADTRDGCQSRAGSDSRGGRRFRSASDARLPLLLPSPWRSARWIPPSIHTTSDSPSV